MTITMRTPQPDLKAGDKVLLEKYKKPLIVVKAGVHQIKLRTSGGKSLWTIRKDYDRVVTKISEVIR